MTKVLRRNVKKKNSPKPALEYSLLAQVKRPNVNAGFNHYKVPITERILIMVTRGENC